MKKIPTVFDRDWSQKNNPIIDKIHPGCNWIFDDGVKAVRKFDGTCCKVQDGKLFKRREVKQGQNTPLGFVLEEKDEITGCQFGWVFVDVENPRADEIYHAEAFKWTAIIEDGTYELIGPKVQGNPEGVGRHILVKHSGIKENEFDVPDNSFEGLREFLKDKDIEGLVFYHPDGRMAKIKKRDYGMSRK